LGGVSGPLGQRNRQSRKEEIAMMRSLKISLLVMVVLAFFVVFATPGLAEEQWMRGRVLGVYPNQQAFVFTQDLGKTWTNIEMARNGVVWIHNRPGKLFDLGISEPVTVVYEVQDGRILATKVISYQR
jgi:hypothetical protein